MAGPDPSGAVQAVSALRNTYTEAEQIMLQTTAKRLQRGITEPGWAEAKLAETQALKRDLTRVVERVNSTTATQLGALMREAEKNGSASIAQALRVANVGPVGGVFTKVNPYAVTALYTQTFSAIEQANFRILRSTLDQYRSIVAQSSAFGVIGVETRQQVSQRALDKWAKQGLTGFTDKAGRRWTMDAYAEMSARTAITRSFIEGRISKIAEHTPLVKVDDSPEECPWCRPWEGKILAIEMAPESEGYPSLEDAKLAGLFHANCTHSVNAYFPDIQDVIPNEKPPEANPQGYEDRQRQREIERNIREARRRAAVAKPGSPEAIHAKAKLRQWQAEEKRFLDATGRRRLPERSSITATGRRVATPKLETPPTPVLPNPFNHANPFYGPLEGTQWGNTIRRLATTDEMAGAVARVRAFAPDLTYEEAEAVAYMNELWVYDSDSIAGKQLYKAAVRSQGAVQNEFSAAVHNIPDVYSAADMAKNAAYVSYADAEELLKASQAALRRSLGDRAMTGTMRVYRGYTPPRGVEYKVGEVVDLDLNPLSSWTTDRYQAGDFGSHTLQMDVPLYDVAGMAGTGLGGGSMEEVVVFARRGQKARVIEVSR